MKTHIRSFLFAIGMAMVATFAMAEMVEEEAITLDPSGMISRKKVMVEKKAAPASEKKGVPDAEAPGDLRAPAQGNVPFLTEERVNRFDRYKDCWVEDGRVCLRREPVQGADGCVVIEAEEGKSVQTEDGRVAVGFDEADGCRYAAFLNRAEYGFEVKTDGAYQSWHRAWFPVRGSWGQSETLDREPPHAVVDSVDGKQPDKEWVWVKGPVYNLTVGTHRLTLDYHAGARLDKIVLAPAAYEPKGKGPTANYNDPPATGRAETVALSPLAIEKWYRLNLNPLGGGGQVDAQYSLDGGKTWKPVPSNGDLQGIGTGPDGGKELKLAFELKSSSEGITPMLIGPALKFVGAQPLAFGNDRIELRFSTSKGNVVGIRNRRSRTECLASGSQTDPLVDLTILKDGALKGCPEPVLKEQSIGETKNGKVLTQKYQWFEGQIEAVVTVTLGNTERAIFNIAVNNRGEDPIVHVDFPRLSGLRIGTTGADDYAYISASCGVNNLFKDPGNTPLMWNYTQQYPWMAGMKWMDLWDPSGGLYVASHDATFRDTAMLVGGSPEDSISFLFRKLVYVAPGKNWNSEPYCVAAHPGDWHWASREYGAWARTCQKPPDNPRWLKEEFDGFCTGANGEARFQGYMNVRRVVEANAARGYLVDTADAWQGFDTMAAACTLYPYPRPDQGGAEEFAQMCEMVKQMGGHTMWYINWLLITPGYATHPRIGMMAKKLLSPDAFLPDRDWVERAAARSPSGEYLSEIPQADSVYCNTKFCDSTAEFSRYKVAWAEKYAKDFHADGIYWDCLLDSYGSPCYRVSHHPSGDLGQWIRSSTETLRKMTEVARAANPHAFYKGEGTAQPGIMQYQNVTGSLNGEVYRYAFPECVCLGAGQWDWGSMPPEAALNILNYDFLTGARFQNPDVKRSGGKLPPTTDPDYGNQLLRLQRRVKPLLYPAVFRDTDGLTIDFPVGYSQKSELEKGDPSCFVATGIQFPGTGIRAKRYTLERNGTRVELLNVINTVKQEGGLVTLSESTLKTLKKVWEFNVAGAIKEIPLKRGTTLQIPLPSSLASTLVLVENCEPLITIQAPSYGTWGEKIPIKVKVLNLNDRNISGRLWVGKRNGFNGSEVKYGPIAPGEEQVQDLELTAKKGVPTGRHDLEMLAEGDGLKTNRLFWIYIGNPLRLAIDPSAERLGVDVQMENFSRGPIEGTCALVEDEVLKTPESSYAFQVQPGQKTRVAMPLELKSPLDMFRLARVRVQYGQYKAPLVKAVLPPIPNPDFEIDLAGDGHPDFWMGRSQPGDQVIGYSQWTMDRQDKHTGQASVRLNPPGLNQTSTALVSSGGVVHFGRKYRVKVAIKREVASDKVYAQIGGIGGSLTLGQKGATGAWEEFEGVLSAPKTNPDPRQWEVCPLAARLENGSRGKVWFDSIRVEEIP